MIIKSVPIEKLNPANYNPRKDLQPSDAAYKKLSNSMQKFGCVQPIVWNERTGNVVHGHQRLKILIANGDKTVDVSVVDFPINEEKLLNIALNKIDGEWDQDRLSSLLKQLQDDASIDVMISGFDQHELDSIISDMQTQSISTIDDYVTTFFESGVQQKRPIESVENNPSTKENADCHENAYTITISNLTKEQSDLVTAFLENNGIAYNLS